MKAVLIHQFGGPEVMKYEDADMPDVNPNDVLIKVYATSINPVDWKIRQGAHGKVTFPFILGWDVSGVVEQVGSQVTKFKIGDEVYSRPDINRNGTYAEYVAAREDIVYFKPQSIDHITAAAVPLAGLTAWQGLFEHGKLQAGQRVLIHGAAGGVGTYAVQFAKWKGAYVIGTASEKNIQFLKDLGADEVIDYHNQQFDEVLQDIDLVFDTIGKDTQKRSFKVLKQGGTLISTLGLEEDPLIQQKNIHVGRYMAQSYPQDLKQIAELIDTGKVKPVINSVYPLKDIHQATKISEEGHTRGKIVLRVVE